MQLESTKSAFVLCQRGTEVAVLMAASGSFSSPLICAQTSKQRRNNCAHIPVGLRHLSELE